ncbi:MAG: trypsin-like peptidase domain-containing protein [Gemmatimonadota bacterium]
MVTRRIAVLFATICAAACGGERGASAQQPPAASNGRTIDASRRTAIVDASARVAPAVVSVRVTLPQPRPSVYEQMFMQQPQGTPQSFGTGFILRADGIIITNQHVVANAQQITVTLADGTDVEGRLLGEDPLTDIAVIKVERKGLPVVTVGRSRDLMIGEWAIALGNPYSFLLGNSEPTVTAGVISATGRNILPTGNQSGSYLDMIQTDAAINPGNSGGPLTNGLGEVIGVNSSIFSENGGSVGLGFAIPIERVVRVADEIIRNGAVRRAWVGLTVNPVAGTSDWKQNGGVPVGDVAAGGPAARAGIRSGDVLTEANGKRLRNYLDWDAVQLDLHVGDSVVVVGKSRGASFSHRIITGDLPSVTAQKVRVLQNLDLITVTPAIQAERRIQSTAGALVFRVPRDVTEQTGLTEGDVIIGINGTTLRSAEEIGRALQAIRPGSAFILNIERGGMRGNLRLQLN